MLTSRTCRSVRGRTPPTSTVAPRPWQGRMRPATGFLAPSAASFVRKLHGRELVTLQASGDKEPIALLPEESTPTHELHDKKKILGVKMQLLAAVASLDRGLAANGREAREVDELVKKLESMAHPVTLTWSQPPVSTPEGTLQPSTLDTLNGYWRLVYTSGFNTGSLGGRRPGPPAALVPSILGQVYQRVDASTGRLDNIVEFLFLLPSIESLLKSFQLGSSNTTEYPESPALRLTLKHDYEIQGRNTVQITYEDTSAELVGSSMFSQLPKFDLPHLPDALKPPRGIRSATFDVVFLDSNMRITRGDRGELRVYLKDDAAAASLGGTPIAMSDEEWV